MLRKGKEYYLGMRGVPGSGGTSLMKTPLKGLRSVPKVKKNGPINDILVYFLLAIIFDEFFPLISFHHSFRKLISLSFLIWTIKVYLGST